MSVKFGRRLTLNIRAEGEVDAGEPNGKVPSELIESIQALAIDRTVFNEAKHDASKVSVLADTTRHSRCHV